MRHDFPHDAPRAGVDSSPFAATPTFSPAPSPGPAPAASRAPAEDSPFSWPTLALVRSLPVAVAEQWIHGGLIAAAAQMAAEDARRSALPFARALVALKREWSHLPELRQLPITDARDLLDQLVTAIIRANYALGAGTVDVTRGEASGEASDAAAVGPAPVGARERSASVARMLLDVIHTYVPDDRLAGAARPLDGVPPSSAPTDADLEARLLRALDGLSPTEAAALTDGLQHLHAELRARRWPRAAARGGASLPFRRPTR